MAYVAARGGEDAIQNAEHLYRELFGGVSSERVQALEDALPYLLDRIMGEASLYAPQLAALALTQSGGDLYEAVLLLRAFRSTQPRLAYAFSVKLEESLTVRRISAAFKDIPGGQTLGPTLDYSHRVLMLEHLKESASPLPDALEAETAAPAHYPLTADWLREGGLLPPAKHTPVNTPEEVAELPDLTREPPQYPVPRGLRLQALARADTGGVLALGYANMRGYGTIHPTVNEVRLAYAEVNLRHPVTGETFSAGRVRVSQAEVVGKFTRAGSTVSATGAVTVVPDRTDLELGMCATLGWNETKLIAGAMLDVAMNLERPHPSQTEEFVLSHTEAVESSGFCIHYKLPHYVTFSSDLDSVRGAKAGGNAVVAGEVTG